MTPFTDKLNPKLLFKTSAPADLTKYHGKSVVIDGKKIVIETIVGNRFKPAFFEVNGQHLIGMLRFFAQMSGDKSITEDQFKAFEEIQMQAERLPLPAKPKEPKEAV